MKKHLAALLALALLGAPLFAQGLSTPMATVKLTKTEIISEKAFRDDVAKVEAMRKKALSADERKAFLDDMIDDILFYQMCERDGIKTSDAEVNAAIAQSKSQVSSQLGKAVSDAEYESLLASQGTSLADLRSYYRKQILLRRWIYTAKAAEIKAIPPITSDEILRNYDLLKAKLVRPETVRVAFIYYPFQNSTQAERDKGAKIIKELSERLAKGESFDALRLRAADGTYGATRDYIYLPKVVEASNEYGKELFDAVFSLKDGTVSAPIENDKGWWLVRKAETFPQKQRELSDPYQLGQQPTVQDFITQSLAQQRESEFISKTLQELKTKLRSQAEVKIIGKP